MNKVTKLYNDLLDAVHERGWNFRHITSKTYYGEIRPSRKTIIISRELKNTTLGCSVLAHEYKHLLDFENDKYPLFFYSQPPMTDPEIIKEAMLAETSAFKFERRILAAYGFDISKLYYLDSKYFKNVRLRDSILDYTTKKTWNYGSK